MKRYRWNRKKCFRNIWSVIRPVLEVIAFLAFCSIGTPAMNGL